MAKKVTRVPPAETATFGPPADLVKYGPGLGYEVPDRVSKGTGVDIDLPADRRASAPPAARVPRGRSATRKIAR